MWQPLTQQLHFEKLAQIYKDVSAQNSPHNIIFNGTKSDSTYNTHTQKEIIK